METSHPSPIIRRSLSLALLSLAAILPAEVLGEEPLPPAFGRALAWGVTVEGKSEYRQRPITVELWAKLYDSSEFNILVASETKDSPEHWELYTTANKRGTFAFYHADVGRVDSGVPICDGQWYHLAAVIEPGRVRLYVDGVLVKDADIPSSDEPLPDESYPGLLAFGRLVEGTLRCDGELDNIRISHGVREIDGVPSEPLKDDEITLGLWDFDDGDI